MNNEIPKEIDVSTIRWIIYPKNGKPIVENHQYGKTWKKVYKDNYGNIEAVCFQIIPEGIKYFADVSPMNEYWTFEEFICQFGGSTKHIARGLASRIDKDNWSVVLMGMNKKMSKVIMNTKDIGYESLNFINAEEKIYI